MIHRNLPPLYHVSPSVFERPSLAQVDHVAAGRVVNDGRSSNGVLGLWISPYPSSCSGFGPEVYRVTLSEARRDLDVPLKQLFGMQRSLEENEASWEQQVEFYLRKRAEWASLCDVVHIRQAEGVGEIIVVNLDIITGFEHLEGANVDDFPHTRCWYDDE